jgi:viroplasmin and RNaseH domain-containing protein
VFFLAEYKKFDIRSDAQDYLDGKVKIQKTTETKSPMKKSKISNNIPVNLMKDTIRQFSAKKMISSYEKLAVSDTNYDDQGKNRLRKIQKVIYD